MRALLPQQPADVAVGRLDHGVEVVGVAAVDLAALHPGQQHAHRVRERPVVWAGGREEEEEEEEGEVRGTVSTWIKLVGGFFQRGYLEGIVPELRHRTMECFWRKVRVCSGSTHGDTANNTNDQILKNKNLSK